MTNTRAARALEKSGARGFHVDMRSPDEVTRLVGTLSDIMPRIDVLVNNAVMVCDKTIVSLSEQGWDDVVSVGLHAPVRLATALARLLAKRPAGKIINIISRTGIYGSYGQVNYATAKGALIACTKQLAAELGPRGITVNGVNPGFMMSRITRVVPSEVKEYNKKRSCLNTFASPREAADFIVYLMSERVKTVSGQIFDIDSRLY
jgi:3-oxoacyl-[acyl-carrier protein] reductase